MLIIFGFFTNEKPYGRTFETESFADRVFQKAFIRKVHKVGVIHEEHERRRAGSVLHGVINFKSSAVFARRLGGAYSVGNDFV